MGLQERLEGFHRFLALAGGGEHHGGALALQVDEHGDVVVAPLGGRLVQGESLQGLQIKLAKSLAHIVFDDPP